MKKIVLITGSPRRNSNTGAMADSFEAAVIAKGAEVERIDATKLNIGGCHACLACYKTGKPCAFDDDFNKIANSLIEADGIVIAAPVYWYSMPTKVKAIIDKFYCLYCGGHLFTGKKCALMSCCEDEHMETFAGINFCFEETFKLMEAEIVGKIELPGVAEAGDIKKTDGERRAAELAELFV